MILSNWSGIISIIIPPRYHLIVNGKPIKDLIIGLLIGIVAQLPGASGATIAVVFKVYERLIEDVANIKDKLFKDLRFIIPLGIGGILGYLFCAKALNFLVEDYYIPMLFFFAMLILVQIPDINNNIDKNQKITKWNLVAYAAGAVIMIMLFVMKITMNTEGTELNFIIMFCIGLVVIASMLSPGISGSTILLVLGVYTAFLEALSNLDFRLLIPFALGLVIGLIVFAKIINHCMKNHKNSTYYAILGLTVGSIVSVIMEAIYKLNGNVNSEVILLSVLCAVIGLAFGVALCKLARKYSSDSGL